MGNTTIPHTFVAGTKAKASEVNENFIAVKDAIDKKAEDIGDPLKTFCVADAQEETQAISKGQLESTKEEIANLISTKGCVYCLKSGNTTNGKADLFGISDKTVTAKVGGEYDDLVLVAIDGQLITKTSLNTISMIDKTDGTYNIFIPEEGDAYVCKNVIYIQQIPPISPIADDIWLDTSLEPLIAKKYVNSAWETFTDIPAGKVKITSDSIESVETIPYNQNGYFVNLESVKSQTELAKRITNLGMPDYTKGVSQSMDVTYTADRDGYLYYIVATSTNTISLYVYDENNKVVLFVNDWFNNENHMNYNGFYPLAKGDRYRLTGGSGRAPRTVTFYPAKGVI